MEWFIDHLSQLTPLGAYGWLDDHDPARLISLAKMLQVVDGTAEIQRIVIARELVRRVDGA